MTSQRPEKTTDQQEIRALTDDELDAVVGGKTNFETAEGQAFLKGFRSVFPEAT